MSRLHGKATGVYLDERDYTGITNAVTLTVDISNAEVTAFEDVAVVYVEGKAGVAATINGFYSLSNPNYDGQSFTDLVTAQQVGIYPGGAADGSHGYEFEGYVDGQPRSSASGNAVALNANFKGDDPLTRLVTLRRGTAISASENGTAYQHGAIGATSEAYGVLRAFSVSGGPGTLDVKVQSDDGAGFGSPTDVLTFTQATGATVETKTAAGPILDDWWRAVITIAGGGTWNLLIAFGQRLA